MGDSDWLDGRGDSVRRTVVLLVLTLGLTVGTSACGGSELGEISTVIQPLVHTTVLSGPTPTLTVEPNPPATFAAESVLWSGGSPAVVGDLLIATGDTHRAVTAYVGGTAEPLWVAEPEPDSEYVQFGEDVVVDAAAGLAYVLWWTGDGKDGVLALDVETGALALTYDLTEEFAQAGRDGIKPHARITAAANGVLMIALWLQFENEDSDLLGVDAASGTQLWFRKGVSFRGESESVVLVKDQIEPRRVIGLNVETGDDTWAATLTEHERVLGVYVAGGAVLVGGSSGPSSTLFDAATGIPITTVPVGYDTCAGADPTLLVCAGGFGTVISGLNTTTGASLWEIEVDHGHKVVGASSRYAYVQRFSDGPGFVVDVASGAIVVAETDLLPYLFGNGFAVSTLDGVWTLHHPTS